MPILLIRFASRCLTKVVAQHKRETLSAYFTDMKVSPSVDGSARAITQGSGQALLYNAAK